MNILLTSVGRRTYMVRYFQDALDGAGKVHAANSEFTYAMQVADKSVITPLIYSNKYIDFVLEYSKRHSINAIISLFDIDLPILAKNKIMFEKAGIQVLVSNPEIVNTCNDKWITYLFLKKHGFDSPKTFLHLSDVRSEIGVEIEYPLIIKPRWGMASIGMYEADDHLELSALYNKVKNDISRSYLKYGSRQDLDNNVIVQEKITGQEYGIDVFNDLDGNYLTSVPKRKIAMRAGETDMAEIIDDISIMGLAAKIGRVTKHLANLDVDCILSNGKWYILEMNCRFGGQYPFSHLAGVDFPRAIVQMLSGIKVNPDILIAKAGVIGIKDLFPVKLLVGN